MNIGSGNKYPCNALSNFAPHPFIIDEVECNSMEGFLQGLKFKNPEMQKEVCTLVGIAAKRKGAKKKWKQEGILWWKGEPIDRFSDDYQELLDKAFEALSKNTKFQKALLASMDAVLQHSIGKRKQKDTVLTIREFCGRLTLIREKLKNDKQG